MSPIFCWKNVIVCTGCSNLQLLQVDPQWQCTDFFLSSAQVNMLVADYNKSKAEPELGLFNLLHWFHFYGIDTALYHTRNIPFKLWLSDMISTFKIKHHFGIWTFGTTFDRGETRICQLKFATCENNMLPISNGRRGGQMASAQESWSSARVRNLAWGQNLAN